MNLNIIAKKGINSLNCCCHSSSARTLRNTQSCSLKAGVKYSRHNSFLLQGWRGFWAAWREVGELRLLWETFLFFFFSSDDNWLCLKDTKDHYWPGLVLVSEAKPKEGGEQNHFCLLWVILSWTWNKTDGPENIQKTVSKIFTFLRQLLPKSNHPSSWRQKWDLGRQGKQAVYANTAWASPYKGRSSIRISTQSKSLLCTAIFPSAL